MAENVSISEGAGISIAADDIADVKYQRIKVVHGSDGVNDGDVSSSNPLPVYLPEVTVAALIPPAPITGYSTETTLGTINGHADSIDSKITECNTGNVVLSGGTSIIGKVGIDQVTANANEVVVKSGSCTVDLGANNDVTVTSGTITANLGSVDNAVLDAIQAGTDKIIASPATESKQDTINTSINTLLKPASTLNKVSTVDTITNVVHMDDNGGSLTVDGTLAVTNPGITSIDGKITVCNTGAVVVSSGSIGLSSSIPAGNNNIGDVDVASIAAGDNNIGNVDIASSIPSGTNIIGAVKKDIINYTPIRKYYTNEGAVTDGIIWSPTSGKKWVITDLIINISAAAAVTLEDDLVGGDNPFMKFELAANGGVSTNFQTPIVSGEADADLIITTSAGNVYATVTGYEI